MSEHLLLLCVSATDEMPNQQPPATRLRVKNESIMAGLLMISLLIIYYFEKNSSAGVLLVFFVSTFSHCRPEKKRLFVRQPFA
jgi:hypothetical protein